jgi:GNAT superfamily N-acetyltransferase
MNSVILSDWVEKGHLVENDYFQIIELQKKVKEADPILFEIDNQMASECFFLLVKKDGKLIAYAALFQHLKFEVKVYGSVHPEERRKGIWTEMIASIKEWANIRGLKTFFIVERASQTGESWVKAKQLSPLFSEFRLERSFLEEAEAVGHNNRSLIMHQATSDQATRYATFELHAFQSNESVEDRAAFIKQRLESLNYDYYEAFVGDLKVGQVCLGREESINGIFALAVHPSFRGKGYGEEILWKSLNLHKKTNQHDIYLEVSIENETALGLYERVGFKKVSAYDYYLA